MKSGMNGISRIPPAPPHLPRNPVAPPRLPRNPVAPPRAPVVHVLTQIGGQVVAAAFEGAVGGTMESLASSKPREVAARAVFGAGGAAFVGVLSSAVTGQGIPEPRSLLAEAALGAVNMVAAKYGGTLGDYLQDGCFEKACAALRAERDPFINL